MKYKNHSYWITKCLNISIHFQISLQLKSGNNHISGLHNSWTSYFLANGAPRAQVVERELPNRRDLWGVPRDCFDHVFEGPCTWLAKWFMNVYDILGHVMTFYIRFRTGTGLLFGSPSRSKHHITRNLHFGLSGDISNVSPSIHHMQRTPFGIQLGGIFSHMIILMFFFFFVCFFNLKCMSLISLVFWVPLNLVIAWRSDKKTTFFQLFQGPWWCHFSAAWQSTWQLAGRSLTGGKKKPEKVQWPKGVKRKNNGSWRIVKMWMPRSESLCESKSYTKS